MMTSSFLMPNIVLMPNISSSNSFELNTSSCRSSILPVPIISPPCSPFIPPPRPPRPSPHPSEARPPSSEIFVGGISRGIDVMCLKEAFSHFGKVIDARIIADRETGKSREFGFVKFNTNGEAFSAIAGMNGRNLHGRFISVKYATPPNAPSVIPPSSPPNSTSPPNAPPVIPPPSNYDLHRQVDELQRQIKHISMGSYYTGLASPPSQNGYIGRSIYGGSASSSFQNGTSAPWIFDSGASFHMINDVSLLTTIDNNVQFPIVHTANGSTLDVTHYGTICQPSGNLTLPSVFVAPALRLNIISISHLCLSGLIVSFSSTSCVVQDPRTGRKVGAGSRQGTLYHLDYLHVPSVTFVSSVVTPTPPTTTVELWHRRL